MKRSLIILLILVMVMAASPGGVVAQEGDADCAARSEEAGTLLDRAQAALDANDTPTALALIAEAKELLAPCAEPVFFPAGSSNRDWTPVIQEFDGVEMVLVPAGCFRMGTPDEQLDPIVEQCKSVFDQMSICDTIAGESPAHEVCFEEPFWIDRTEVTNAQFAAFNGEARPPNDWPGENRPRASISWYEAKTFCEENRGLRLPTEAEWEYAARGPESWVYPWGNEFVADNVVYADNSDNQPAEVGSRPNGASWVGALDMSGNVMEWVGDWYAPYTADSQINPTGPDSGVETVLKGGGFDYPNDFLLRSALRGHSGPAFNYSLGFRCARSD
jgi:formylglycine-generating enzyme required for sulfatase activity